MSRNGRGNSGGDSKLAPFLFGALAGGIVGAALALLYAPAEGKELRKTVGDKMDDLTDSINGILQNAKSSAEKMLHEGRGPSDEFVDMTRERADDLIEDADRAMEEARRRTASGVRTNGSTNGMSSGTHGDGSLGANEGGFPSGYESDL